MTGPAPAPGAPLDEVRAWLSQYGTDVATWPKPTPEQVERLRALFGYITHPAAAGPAEERRAS
jgi:hypothetical protein